MLELYTSPVRRRWHLEIESCFNGGIRGVGAEPRERQRLYQRVMLNLPVGHDEAVEFPFSSKEVLDQPFILRAYQASQYIMLRLSKRLTVRPIDTTVRSHKRPRLRILLRQHERHQVNLSQSPRPNLNVDGESLVFLVIAYEVLDCRADAVGLKALDIGGREVAREVRVFGEGFESLCKGQPGSSISWKQQLTLPFIGFRWILQVGANRNESPLAFASRASNPPAAFTSSVSNVAPRAVSQGIQVAAEGLKWLEPRIPFYGWVSGCLNGDGRWYVRDRRCI
jgi:hypothetical protein